MNFESILTRHRWLPIIVLTGLTLLLWLPFSFNVGPTMDDWFFFANGERGFAWGVPTRPLLGLAHGIAQMLTPGSFIGSNLILAALIMGRSLAVYGILRRLGVNAAVALVTAALTLTFPADSGVFYRGALTVYVSGLAYLIAVYCLLAALDQPRLRWYVGMWLALLVCVMSYEAQYVLIALTPALLWLVRPRLDARWRALTLRWYLFPVLWAVYYAITALTTPAALSYQADIRAPLTPQALVETFAFVYDQHLLSAWLASVAQPLNLTYSLVAAAAGLLVSSAALVMQYYKEEAALVNPVRRHVTPLHMLMIGVVVIGAGIAVYLPSTVRTETLRTYFVTSVGGALVFSALFAGLSHRIHTRLPLIIGSGILVALGMFGLLHQHAGYQQRSAAQQRFLVDFARIVPQPATNTGIAVIFESTDEMFALFQSAWRFPQMFIVLYGDPWVAAVACPATSFDLPLDQQPCQFNDEGIYAQITQGVWWQRPYDRLIVMMYDGGTFEIVDDITPYAADIPQAAAYDPEALIDRSLPLPPRACTLFTIQVCD